MGAVVWNRVRGPEKVSRRHPLVEWSRKVGEEFDVAIGGKVVVAQNDFESFANVSVLDRVMVTDVLGETWSLVAKRLVRIQLVHTALQMPLTWTVYEPSIDKATCKRAIKRRETPSTFNGMPDYNLPESAPHSPGACVQIALLKKVGLT